MKSVSYLQKSGFAKTDGFQIVDDATLVDFV